MGVVHRAHDYRLKRQVAIKQLYPRTAANPAIREMFQREAETMARVRHPNVVAVYDSGIWRGQPYLVMPFHDSPNLEGWAEQRGGPPMPLGVIVGIIGQACAGIMAMHEIGLVHGDLKPRNILVSDALEVVLVDLGLSRPIAARHDPSLFSGTPGYVAPEIIRREPIDPAFAHALDVYSLGVTSYWLLTGQTPWGRGGSLELFLRQVEDDIVPPSELRPDLPSSFDAPIQRALEHRPSHRPTAAAFRDQLLRAAYERQRSTPFIVVVDDDPNSLLLQTEIARATVAHAEVVGVRDPRAALSIIDNRPTDLVITDLMMPRFNGIELAAVLRGSASTASIPIIVVTGVGGADEWTLLHTIGVECLLIKPLRPAVLGDAIRRALPPPH